MDRTERFYHIDRLLNEQQVVPVQVFIDELEVSLATFKRDLEYLRERFNAPIVWDRDAGGYRFGKSSVGPRYELPGLWFNASEVYARRGAHDRASHRNCRCGYPGLSRRGYGIFSGKDVEWAELEFTAEAARWVGKELWHPDQQGSFNCDGSYRLRVPFSNPTELTMDILRHVPAVKVIGPESLRTRVRGQLELGLAVLCAHSNLDAPLAASFSGSPNGPQRDRGATS